MGHRTLAIKKRMPLAFLLFISIFLGKYQNLLNIRSNFPPLLLAGRRCDWGSGSWPRWRTAPAWRPWGPPPCWPPPSARSRIQGRPHSLPHLGGKFLYHVCSIKSIHICQGRLFVCLSVPADYSEPELCWAKCINNI